MTQESRFNVHFCFTTRNQTLVVNIVELLYVLLSFCHHHHNYFQIGLDVRTATQVSSVYIPQTVSLLNSFVSLHWIMEQLALPSPSNAV